MRLISDALLKRLSVLGLTGLILAGCQEVHYGLPQMGDEPEEGQPAMQPPAPMAKEPVMVLSQGWVQGDEAVDLLQGDTIALRFLVLKQLVEAGVIPPQAALPRFAANKGALLPLTKPAPAVGLDRQIPSVLQIRGVLQGLPMDSAAVTVVLDSILPQSPKVRQKLAPQTKVAARLVLDRLARLEATGLITPAERIAEAEAVAQLILGDSIPETDVVPPPPPPPPPAPAPPSKGKGGAAHRSLDSMFVPDPGTFRAPKLDAKASGPAGLFLMQIPDPSQADKAWNMLKTQSPELATMGMVLVRTDLGDVGVTWRLVAGPVTADEARNLCDGIRPKKQDCTPVPFPKNGVQPPAPKMAAPAADHKTPEAAPEK